ncbi:hypothetical protein GDO81_005020 [Engystomops pustulosus]|uniref:B30.2/SPRY domain-containing protein n=1 Tax=Engystomops pustulosus TaxID=76066 RepID=A0AAV7CKV8_ENGPU|nr:hypothetical protein GDO81_005020 [Engystomops pustulosus]
MICGHVVYYGCWHFVLSDQRYCFLKVEVLNKRKMVTAGFESLRQLLADEETNINHRLENIERVIKQRRNESVSRLDEKITSLQKVITDLEKNVTISSSQIFSLSLDLKTVNKNLLVTGNQKCVKYQEEPLRLAPCLERFDSKPCVLATTGFRLGKYYWEVEVGGGIYWTIGIARQSVRRKGMFRIEPQRGIWAIGLLGMYSDRYYAFTSPDTLLNPKEQPERVGVYLNCDEGSVSFYNALSQEHLFTFNFLKVPEKLYPFFCVGALGTELKLD